MGIGHNGEQKQMPTRLGSLQKGRVGVGTRTLNKLILKGTGSSCKDSSVQLQRESPTDYKAVHSH